MLLVFSVCRTVLVAGDAGPRKRSAFVASMPVVLAILDRLDLVPSSPERTKLACAALSTSACGSTGKKDVGVDAIRSGLGQRCILHFLSNFWAIPSRRHHLIGAVTESAAYHIRV